MTPTFRIEPSCKLLAVQPVMLFAALAVYAAFAQQALRVVRLTAGTNGTHTTKSRHYSGLALDFGYDHVPQHVRPKITETVRESLGGLAWDIVDHGTHIHIEYDPKDSVG